MTGHLVLTAGASAVQDAGRSGVHFGVLCPEPGRDCPLSASVGAPELLAA